MQSSSSKDQEVVTRSKREESPRKISHGQESGYGSDGATTNSSRASPRGSLDSASGADHNVTACTNTSVREKILAFQNRTETPSPPTMTKETVSHKSGNPPLLMPKPSKSVVIPPKKPARTKLSQSAGSVVGAPGSSLSHGTESNQNKNKKDSSSSVSAAAAATHSKFNFFPHFVHWF